MKSVHPREAEATALAHVGAALFPQNLRVDVTLPAELAEAARQAWNRDDHDPTNATSHAVRLAAGQLALIGLAVTERGTTTDDGTVRVALDAWQIGSALEAADEAGLFSGE